MAAVLGGVSAAGSLIGGLGGLFGGGNTAANVNIPSLPNFGAAANNAFTGIGNLGQYNLYGQTIPQFQNQVGSLLNNPYAGGAQQGAGTASGLGMAGALNQYNQGGALYGGGNQILNTAFDPQNALFNKLQQQQQDQSNVQNAMSGVATTPYGAGLANQNMQNFDINWQNAQLGRQTQGLGAAGAAFGQGAQLQGSAPNQYLQSAMLPYGTYNTLGSNNLGWLGQLGGYGANAQNQAQQPISDYLQYVGAGQVQQGQQLQQANQVFNQNQAFGSQVGAGLQGLGQAYNSWSNPFASFSSVLPGGMPLGQGGIGHA